MPRKGDTIKDGKAADRALLEAIAARFGVPVAPGTIAGELRPDGLKVTVSVRVERVLPTDQNAAHRAAALVKLVASADKGQTEFHCREMIQKRGYLSSSTCSKRIAFALVVRNYHRVAERGDFDYTFVCGTHRRTEGFTAVVPLCADDLRRVRDLGRRRDNQKRWARAYLARTPVRLTCQIYGCEAPTDHVQMGDLDTTRRSPFEIEAALNFYCKDHRAAETARDLTVVFEFSDWEMEDIIRDSERIQKLAAIAAANPPPRARPTLKVVP